MDIAQEIIQREYTSIYYDFLNRTPLAQEIKPTIFKQVLKKLKSFFTVKAAVH